MPLYSFQNIAPNPSYEDMLARLTLCWCSLQPLILQLCVESIASPDGRYVIAYASYDYGAPQSGNSEHRIETKHTVPPEIPATRSKACCRDISAPIFSYLDSLLLSLRMPLFTDKGFGRLMPTESDTKVKNQAPPKHLYVSCQNDGKELGGAWLSGLTPVIGLTGILSFCTIDQHDLVEVSDVCQRIGEICRLKNCCCSFLPNQEYLARANGLACFRVASRSHHYHQFSRLAYNFVT